MPNRILKDSICSSDNLDQLTPEQEVFWYRLLVQCDDYGRMDARSSILRAKCYPLKLGTITDAHISEWLRALANAKLIMLYTVDGKLFLQVTTWENHQQIRAKRSKYPPMISSDINGNQMQADDYKCPRNPIQSESLSISDDEAVTDTPKSAWSDTVRAAYKADKLMITKTHLDAHLETIKRVGLEAWQTGWKAAQAEGKQNVVNYVARCAESAKLTSAASGNGHVAPEVKRFYVRQGDEDIFYRIENGQNIEEKRVPAGTA